MAVGRDRGRDWATLLSAAAGSGWRPLRGQSAIVRQGVAIAPIGIIELLASLDLEIVSMGRPAADDPVLPALQRWAVADAPAFDAQCSETVLDHGMALYIHAVHLLKTWAAVRDEIALGVPDATAQALRAAVNRLFAARFKQRHLLRTAHQAMGFVARED